MMQLLILFSTKTPWRTEHVFKMSPAVINYRRCIYIFYLHQRIQSKHIQLSHTKINQSRYISGFVSRSFKWLR